MSKPRHSHDTHLIPLTLNTVAESPHSKCESLSEEVAEEEPTQLGEEVSAIPQAPSAPEEGRLERKSPPNHIFIGKKPVMSYAMSSLIQLAQSGEIVLKARGMVISRAVDVAQVVTKRLGSNQFEVKDIKIDTERVGVGDASRNVSTIEIRVSKK